MSNFSLKVLAGIFMVLGHLSIFIDGMPEWFGTIGMFSTPIFLYCLVEGFYHTRSRRKYLNRLLWGTIIVAVGSFIIERIFVRNISLNENLFFTLALGLILMNSIEYMKSSNKSVESILMFVGTIIISICFEWSFISVVMILIFYTFRKDKRKMAITYIIATVLSVIILNIKLVITDGILALLLNPMWIMLASIIPILMYKGRRGALGDRYKRWLYLLYPAHIWGFYIIGYLLK